MEEIRIYHSIRKNIVMMACVHNCPQKAISIIPTPPEPQEPNRNARYRNPNASLADLIKANSQQ